MRFSSLLIGLSLAGSAVAQSKYEAYALQCASLTEFMCGTWCRYFQLDTLSTRSLSTDAEKVDRMCTSEAGSDVIGCFACVALGRNTSSSVRNDPGSDPTTNQTLLASLYDWSNTCDAAWTSQTETVRTGTTGFPAGYSCDSDLFAKEGSNPTAGPGGGGGASSGGGGAVSGGGGASSGGGSSGGGSSGGGSSGDRDPESIALGPSAPISAAPISGGGVLGSGSPTYPTDGGGVALTSQANTTPTGTVGGGPGGGAASKMSLSISGLVLAGVVGAGAVL